MAESIPLARLRKVVSRGDMLEPFLTAEQAATLIRRAELAGEGIALILSWLDELEEAVLAYVKFRRCIPEEQWRRMTERREAGLSMGLEMERKRARLEARLKRLLQQERPGLLQDAA